MTSKAVSHFSAVAWIRLQKFCDLTGYTADAVYAKIRKGTWAQGLHWCKAPDGHVMINVEAYNRWVESAQA